jgi:hypothetical protein
LSDKLKRAIFPMPNHSRHGAYSLTKVFKEFLDLRIDDPRFSYVYNIDTWGRSVQPVNTKTALGNRDYFHHPLISRQQQAGAFDCHTISKVFISK